MYIDQPLQQPLQTVTAKLMDWAQNGLLILPNAVIAVLVVILGWIAARIISTIVERLVARFSPNSDVVRLLGFAAYGTLLAGGIFIALGVLHLDKTVTSLLTGVGILGLTLGFALQDVASNLMAGLLIELNHPFRLNDVIETNHSSALQRRVGFEIKVPPDVELDEALRLAHDAVSGIDSRDRRREIELFFQSIDDTGTTLLVRFWIDSADEIEYLRARSLGIQRTKSAFDHRPQHAQHT